MVFFGLLSTPLPYLLLAIVYFFGFIGGMFFHPENSREAENGPDARVASANVQTEPEKMGASCFYEKIVWQKTEKSEPVCVQPDYSLVIPNNALRFFIPERKLPEFFVSDFLFCRPPPVVG